MAQEGGVQGMSAKAGLEHRNYPYDLNRLKFTTLERIPSLIPTVLISDNRTLQKMMTNIVNVS